MSGDRKNKIVLYCCENSSYKAFQSIEDGTILEHVESVPLPCSGKVEMGLVLKALEVGYAGVLILGCPKDNCKFIRGNYRAEKRTEMVKSSLERAGLAPEKVRLDFISSIDAHKCKRIIGEMVDQVILKKGVAG